MSQLQSNPFDDPPKYRKDSRGAYVPVEAIREIDVARDELVREKGAKIEVMQGQLRALRDELMATSPLLWGFLPSATAPSSAATRAISRS